MKITTGGLKQNPIDRNRARALRAAAIVFIFATWLGSPPVSATPPLDPICAGPSSLTTVAAARSRQAATLSPRRPIGLQGAGRPPRLSIDRSNGLDLPWIILEGAPGQPYQLESTSDLSEPRWEPWLSGILGDRPLIWSDDAFGAYPARYFRINSAEPDAFGDSVSNFRLLDEQGIARDLYYHTHLKAIAVLALGDNLETATPFIPLFDELARTHGPALQIWLLLADPAPVRSNVLGRTRSLKLNFPVLFDPHGIAAHSVGLRQVGEVVLVQPPVFTAAYRGQVASDAGRPAGASFLGEALAKLESPQERTYLRTPLNRPRLSHLSEPIPDYAREIAPMLHKHCAQCHRTGGVAPFAMTNHDAVELWAPAMKHAVLSGRMPPWHADPDYGKWANDLSLPGNLKSSLIRWIDAGAPRGEGTDPLAELPPPPAYDQWPEELGEPDALVTIPVQDIKSTGSEPYRYIFTQAPNPSNVWLRAAIVRPSNYRSVHHYLVWRGRIGNSGAMDSSTYQSAIAGFAPGAKPSRIPEDAGMLLGQSNWLTFNLHYTPYGIVTNDQPVLALWYHKTQPPKEWMGAAAGRRDFVIPPGARDHAVQAEWTFSARTTLHALGPHMHVRGKRMKYEVFYPGGAREVLLSVPDYDFNWQFGYEFAEPKILPAGSRVVVSGAFDNSPQNLANPDPSASVRWGDQSWMEMFVGFMDFTQ